MANRYPPALAAYYDATHDHGTVGDEDYYRDVATTVEGPVLEAGCGTGRLYLDLLAAGVDVDGFDHSAAMLARLHDNADRRGVEPSVWQADFRYPATDRSYAAVLIPYNSFATLLTVEDQLAGLDAIYDVLDPGGRLVFDVFVPRYDVIAESFDEWRSGTTIEYNDQTLTGWTRATVTDQIAQTFRTEQELRNEDGDVVHRAEFSVAHLPPQQVELLARQSRFTEWTVTGDFEGPLEDGDAIQVWELHKPR